MTQNDAKNLQQQFAQLRQDHAVQKGLFQTRSDEFEQLKNRELLSKASEYTVDAIVKGAADLQLDVSSAIAELETKLADEAEKLENLTTAITVAKAEEAELHRIRIAADALSILQQENKDRLQKLAEQDQELRLSLEKEQTEKRRLWEKEDTEFETTQTQEAADLAKERELAEADFRYTQERDRKEEADDQAEADRNQERQLQDRRLQLEKDWKTREDKLTAEEKKYQESKEKVEAFPEELEAAIKKAREESIREATNEAKVKNDLLERDWEASKQQYELQLESLEAAIEAAQAEVAELQAQQQRTAEQTQTLAARAFKGGEA